MDEYLATDLNSPTRWAIRNYALQEGELTKRPASRLLRILLIAMLALAALPAVRILGQEGSGSTQELDRFVTRDTSREIGVDVIELVGGLADNAPQELAIRFGSLRIPQSPHVFWGYGDTPCGYGLEIILGRGTVVCFDDDNAEVEVSRIDPDELHLVKEILSSAPEYKVRPSRTTGELP